MICSHMDGFDQHTSLLNETAGLQPQPRANPRKSSTSKMKSRARLHGKSLKALGKPRKSRGETVTSRIRFVVETVENRGKTVWLVGVNRKETVKEPYTGHYRAIPPAAERLSWPAHKFQDFLRLSQGSGHYFRTSPRENPKSRQLSRGEVEHD